MKNRNDNETNEDEEPSLDQSIDEINENQCLALYLRCDKGSGLMVEDITEFQNEGLISIEANMNEENPSIPEEEQYQDALIWSNVLEEYDPLEYDDKWGRRSPGSHAIKFASKLKTSLVIKHINNYDFFDRHFTIEIWIRPYSLTTRLLKKDSLDIGIENGDMLIKHRGKALAFKKQGDLSIATDTWQHLGISYRRRIRKLTVYKNCELLGETDLTLDENISKTGSVIIGNEQYDGEITEIRLWNQAIPVKFLKENMKCPLSILSESKRKIKTRINKENKKSAGGFASKNLLK